MTSVPLNEYRALMRGFVDGKIKASEFETRYLNLFKGDDSMRPEPIFEILDRLFADVDAFSDDPALRGEDGLDEAGLLAQVQSALKELDMLEPSKAEH